MEEKLAEQKKEEAAVAEASTTPYDIQNTTHARQTMDGEVLSGLACATHSAQPNRNPPKSAAIPDPCGRKAYRVQLP